MKKAMLKNLFIAVPAIFVMACQPSVKVTSDYLQSTDFSSYKSFSLYYLATSRNINQINEERLWKSLRSEMIRKGYVENNQNPDLLVNAVSVMKDKKYLSGSSNIYGYGSIYRPYGYWNGGVAMVSGTSTLRTYDYKDGSIVIDVIDAKTKRLLWEGTGTSQFEKQPKNVDEAIQKAITRIMADFPNGN